MRHSQPGLRTVVAACAGLTLALACFNSEFAQGLPCNDHDDCGPNLSCVEGLCGGPGIHPICGNGLEEIGEDCDDGNQDDTDDCTNDCQYNIGCGNGKVEPGEACDDGNTDDGDYCTPLCALPQCGDGFLALGEACDDDNQDNTDACVAICDDEGCTCAIASCGDGYVQADIETCDDGNADESVCTSECELPTCSDESHNGLETDVDCGGPECEQTCVVGQGCESNEDCTDGFCRAGLCAETVEQVVAGLGHTCVRLNTGAVRCWGNGALGQLGYAKLDFIGDSETPASAGDLNLGDEAVAVELSAGSYHTCARLEGGDLRCWGHNSHGQLGRGHIDDIGDDEDPALVELPLTGDQQVVELAAANRHTCARLSDGGVMCWGRNDNGQLGYANSADLDAIGDDEDLATLGTVELGVAAGALAANGPDGPIGYSCAIGGGAQLLCWGYNEADYGVLGYGDEDPDPGNIGDDETPEEVGALAIAGVTQVAVGGNHICAITEGGQLYCWGTNDSGQLGYGDALPRSTPPGAPIEFESPLVVEQVVLGLAHTCVRVERGQVFCWGQNDSGQLGYANTASENAPPSQPVDVGGTVVELAVGHNHTCALMADGQLRCWGANNSGQLGYGNLETIGDDETPASAGDVPCLLPEGA